MKTVSKYLLALFMLGAGVMHFVNPDFFTRIMPPYLPWHLEIVYLSGIFEIGLGVSLCIPRIAHMAAWATIGLLIAVFPANIHLFMHQELMPAPYWLHLFRLPLQFLFILWAYSHTKTEHRIVIPDPQT